MYSMLLIVASLLGVAADEASGIDLRTVAEVSGFKATARYQDVLSLCERLASSSPLAHLSEIGKSGEGRSIPLLILADPPVKSPEEAAKSGKLVALLVGNIHAGEVCGKEALPMLAREILAQPDHPLLDEYVIAIVPILNTDGNERVSKDNRPGQVGPEEGMGQRANAAGLDLNRDFMKLESPEIRALVRFVNRWDPHLIVDTHTTNGSHHRYALTYQGPQNPAGGAGLIEMARSKFLPAVRAAFKARTGLDSFVYGNFEDDHTRWTGFPATPRFGTNYLGLRNRLAILSEAYSYAPYEERIRSTLAFVQACLETAAAQKAELRETLAAARSAVEKAGREPAAEDRVPIRSAPRPFAEKQVVLGYVEERREGRSRSTGEPRDYSVEVVQDFQPTETVNRPFAYAIPARHTAIVENLQRHGLEVAELREDLVLEVEAYRVDRIERSERAFEGHRLTTLHVTPRGDSRTIEAGTLVVRTAQPLGNLAVYLLEPRSDDGLATWNGFDDGLEAGGDFPVVRLPRPVSLLTVPARPLPEDRPARQPITFDLARGMRGFVAPPRWFDAEHLIQVREGKPHKVEALTGKATPLERSDAMAKVLAELPAIGQARAGQLARRPLAEDATGTLALFEHDEDLYVARLDGGRALRLTSTPGPEQYPTFSPDGKFVAYVRNHDLYVADVASGTERALTGGGSASLRRGEADWVYFEEVFNRNWKAYWWSPDGSRVAFLEFDDAPVGDHALLDDSASRRQVERTPYPRAGEPNPRVRVGVTTVGGGPVRFADLADYSEGSYLVTDVGWWPDGRVRFYVQDRAQTWLDVMAMPADSTSPTRLFRETTRAWVDNPGPPSVLADGSFLLPSERDGWRHLYLFAADGTLKRQVTSGEWEVRDVLRVDSSTGTIDFTGTRDGPVAINLYRTSVEGGAIQRLTDSNGSHAVSFSPDGRYFLDTWSDLETPTQVTLRTGDGTKVRTIDSNPARDRESLIFGPRRRVQIKTADGFALEGEVVLPADLDPEKLYPVWVMTYGGPHAPTVSDGWAGGRMYDQALAAEGIIAFRVDPRSASGKGAVSTWSAYRRLGVQELKDLEEAVAWLKREYPCVDGTRIGLAGHSYGGYLTAFALTHSKLFAAGIAGAPVTDWRDYDSIYTERYMGLPQDNPEGYDASSVVKAAAELHGRLLIAHGAMDDNVSMRNTMRLVQALQQADKDFELMIYPTSRHGIGSRHYSRLQVDFIRRTMGKPRERSRTAD